VRLHVSLLPGPTPEESFCPQFWWESPQFREFARPEIPLCDVLTGELGPNLLHVDTETSSIGEGVNRQTVGMGKVELWR
jgi:hypothetical protein